ncbi:lysoplasmalogenase [bacterium]|jgi:hypothetical protein|nr:lysoplasmalogenase [bacterium]
MHDPKANETLGERLALPLWVMWGGLLFGGMVLAGYSRFDSDPFLKATRLASSLVLVMTGFVVLSGNRFPRAVWPLLMLALGMTLGFLGDISNSGLLITDPKSATMGGIATFAVGHVLYMAACLWICRHQRLGSAPVWIGSMIFWQCAGLLGWWLVIYQHPPLTAVHWAALPYCLLLAGTAGMTTALAIQDRRYFWLGLGGALFLASDLVLAIQLFRDDINIADQLIRTTGLTSPTGQHFCSQVSRHACWLLYGPAQMLIIFSGLSLLGVEKSPRRELLEGPVTSTPA